MNRGAEWIFRQIHRHPALRLSLEVIAAIAVGFGIVGVWIDFVARQEERAVREEERLARMWALATDLKPGNSGKIPALEYLVKNHHSLQGIKIPNSYLVGANLSGADLVRADLSGADLSSADLTGANLSGANLSGDLFFDTNLSSAELSGADLRSARSLDENSLKQACVWYRGEQPLLPESLKDVKLELCETYP